MQNYNKTESLLAKIENLNVEMKRIHELKQTRFLLTANGETEQKKSKTYIWFGVGTNSQWCTGVVENTFELDTLLYQSTDRETDKEIWVPEHPSFKYNKPLEQALEDSDKLIDKLEFLYSLNETCIMSGLGNGIDVWIYGVFNTAVRNEYGVMINIWEP